MRTGLDVARASGLEIGALADPIVRKNEGDIRYVDYTDAEALRRTYADNPGVDVAAIVDVDAIWGEQTLAECIGGGLVDYVMASHVAEHVPDLVTWLAEMRAVLRPGGQLRLALPDMRFSHDALRGETRLVDLLAAWVLRARRPQVRDVLDFRLHVAPSVDARTTYDGTADLARIEPAHSFAAAVEAAGWARDMPQHYFDVHCWVVRPTGFAALMQALARHGLLRLACAGMIDTAPPIWEFYAFLTPCDDPLQAERSWREAAAGLRDPLPGSAAGRRQAEAAAARAFDAAELAAVRARLAAMERSLSWRTTAPLRRLRGRMRLGRA